jgi:hypothetical protein
LLTAFEASPSPSASDAGVSKPPDAASNDQTPQVQEPAEQMAAEQEPAEQFVRPTTPIGENNLVSQLRTVKTMPSLEFHKKAVTKE